MEVFIHYQEREFQDAYVCFTGEPVYTSYVELDLHKAADYCLSEDGIKCEEAALIKDSLPYTGPDDIESMYVVVCRFNNIAANIYEDWNIVGCYVSEAEAEEMAEDFSLHTSELRGLSDALVLLYCDTHELPYKKV
jgi:hypothetical protein